MAVTRIATPNRYVGLSTDVKPTDGPAGSRFTERDTGLTYVWDLTAWGVISISARANTWTATQTFSANGVGVTPTDRIVLTNTTAATVGAQQISPATHYHGSGWKTNAVAAAQDVDERTYLVPVQGAANPSSYLTWEFAVNGGAYTEAMRLTSAGVLSRSQDTWNITIASAPQTISVSQAIAAGGADGTTVKERQRLLYATNGNPYYQIWSPSAAAWVTVWWYDLNVYSQGSALETMQFAREVWFNPPAAGVNPGNATFAYEFDYGGLPTATPPNSGNTGVGWLGFIPNANLTSIGGNGTMFYGAENALDFAIATTASAGAELPNTAIRRLVITGDTVNLVTAAHFINVRTIFGSTHAALTVGSSRVPYIQILGNTAGNPSDSEILQARFTNDTAAATYKFLKSKATAPGSFGAVTWVAGTRQYLGGFLWLGDDGTTYNSQAAFIYAYTGGAIGTGIVPGELLFGTNNTSGTGVDALRIDAQQSVILGRNEGQTTAITNNGILRSPDMLGGTTSNAAGTSLTISSGLGTGTGTLSTVVIQAAVAAVAGTTIQTRATVLTIGTALTTLAASSLLSVANTTDASSLTVAAVVLAGGLAVTKTLWVGTSIVLGASNKISPTSGVAGFSVVSTALTLGSAGSMVIPYLSQAAAAFTDAIGGNVNGAIGINHDSTPGLDTIEVRVEGAWLSVAVAGTLFQNRVPLPDKGYWTHAGQRFEADGQQWLDESRCVVCGEPIRSGEQATFWANREHARGTHAVYGHLHAERDTYIQGLEQRIRELEAKLGAAA